MTVSTQSRQAVSADGTTIAVDVVGVGPAVVLVDGAMCYRGMGPSGPLAKELAGRFTVYTYDRRGRGDSGDTAPYAVDREVEDLAAVIAQAGGSADVYGISSGAALAAEGAAKGLPIRKLALYEAPFVVGPGAPPRPDDLTQQFDALIADGRRADAVRLFMKTVGVPGFVIRMMRLMPAWSKLTGVAHTLPYDFRVLGDTGSGKPLPAQRWAGATMPMLVMDGGRSPAWMREAQQAFAQALPNATHRTVPGQTHMLKAKAVAPILTDFFTP